MNKNKYLEVFIARRRLFVAGAAWPALAWARASCAQAPAKVRRIGFLSPYSPADAAPWQQAFRAGLSERGWIEDRNISVEYRYADGNTRRLPELAAELVRLKVDVIVTSAQSDATVAQKVIQAIPVVMAAPGDPVAIGLVASLARPGSNMTGLTQMAPELAGKRLELLKEIVPALSRVAVLWNPRGAASPLSWKEMQGPARQLGIQLQSVEVSSAGDLDKAFETMTRARAGALVITGEPLIIANLKQIADLATKRRLPSVYQVSTFADAGGLLTYGPDRADLYRRAAIYVDKILKGAKPADLPVEQPTKFELVINMKTAKALGIAIPPAVLVRATKVIE